MIIITAVYVFNSAVLLKDLRILSFEFSSVGFNKLIQIMIFVGTISHIE